MRKLFSLHASFFLFQAVIIILMIGLTSHSGSKHWDKIAIVLCSLYPAYFLFAKFQPGKKFIEIKMSKGFSFDHKTMNRLLLFTTLSLIILDLIILKGLPGYQALFIENTHQYTQLRKGIHLETPLIFKYLSSINTKAILPFAILHFLVIKKYREYYLLVGLASLFAFGMMQKSFILLLLLPALIYAGANRKYWQVLLHSCIIVFVIFALTLPTLYLKNVDEPMPVEKTEKITDTGFFGKFKNSISGLTTRVFVLPGEMVSHWFEIVPDKKPFLYGDGYPMVAAMRGRSYRNYELELYAEIYPKQANLGYAGSVNVATFVREYANFGSVGLVFSGISLAIAFYILSIIFIGNTLLFFAINLFPIFLLSSGNLLTIMFSGGWAFSIVLFFLFKNHYLTQKPERNL